VDVEDEQHQLALAAALLVGGRARGTFRAK
jgi:hypothetical protein